MKPLAIAAASLPGPRPAVALRVMLAPLRTTQPHRRCPALPLSATTADMP